MIHPPHPQHPPHPPAATPSASIQIDPIFEAICRGDVARLLQIEDPRFSAAAIAAWHAEPANQLKLQQFTNVFETQARVLSALAQTEAIFALLHVVRDVKTKPETLRKTSLDLLKVAAELRAGKRLKAASSKVADPSNEQRCDELATDSANAEHRSEPQQQTKLTPPATPTAHASATVPPTTKPSPNVELKAAASAESSQTNVASNPSAAQSPIQQQANSQPANQHHAAAPTSKPAAPIPKPPREVPRIPVPPACRNRL